MVLVSVLTTSPMGPSVAWPSAHKRLSQINVSSLIAIIPFTMLSTFLMLCQATPYRDIIIAMREETSTWESLLCADGQATLGPIGLMANAEAGTITLPALSNRRVLTTYLLHPSF